MKSINDIRENKKPSIKKINSVEREKSQQFYQSKEWKACRETYIKNKRKEHEDIVIEVYENNLDKNSPNDLTRFIETDLPLSEQSLKEGKIRCSNQVDHKKPISDGGAKFDFDNLQILTHQQHSRKTYRENN